MILFELTTSSNIDFLVLNVLSISLKEYFGNAGGTGTVRNIKIHGLINIIGGSAEYPVANVVATLENALLPVVFKFS